MQRNQEIKEALARVIIILAQRAGQWVLASRLRVDQPKASMLLHGKLDAFSVERLMYFVTRLGHDVIINVRPAAPTATRRPRHGRLWVEADTNERWGI